MLAIAKEVIFNAFLHSQGTVLKVEIAYLSNALRFRARDNGVGMSEPVLQTGRPNHWGLEGMRERADEIAAQFHIWSCEGEGCEIEITVPANTAFVARARVWQRWLGRVNILSSR